MTSSTLRRVLRMTIPARCLILCAGILTVCLLSAAPAGSATHSDTFREMTWIRILPAETETAGWYRWAVDTAVYGAESAELIFVSDGYCSLHVNGQRLLRNAAPQTTEEKFTPYAYDIQSLLRQGRNTVAVELNAPKEGAVFGIGIRVRRGTASADIGGSWKSVAVRPPVGWQQTDFNDRDWAEFKAERSDVSPLAIQEPYPLLPSVIPPVSRQSPFEFQDGDRIVFVGATFVERAQLSEHIEAMLTGTLGNRHVTFRNLGWSADTVFADSRGIFDRPEVGYLRMVEQIRAEEPTVAFICYGQNESLTPGITPEQYSKQLGRLLDELHASGIACVLISPHELLPAPLPLPSPSRFNPRVKEFLRATQEVAAARGLLFIDLFENFAEQLNHIDHILTDSDSAAGITGNTDGLTSGDRRPLLTENGLHFTDHGYRCTAIALRQRLLGIPATIPEVSVQSGVRLAEGTGVSVRNVRWNPDAEILVSFDVQEQYLSALPLRIRLKDLSVNGVSVSLRAGTRSDTEASSTSILSGHNADHDAVFVAAADPQYDALRNRILRKNELYFHRWRPQNITYLFGFRKHEQGNNAADIAKFDPFIQKLESEIQHYQAPQWRTVVVSRKKEN